MASIREELSELFIEELESLRATDITNSVELMTSVPMKSNTDIFDYSLNKMYIMCGFNVYNSIVCSGKRSEPSSSTNFLITESF